MLRDKECDKVVRITAPFAEQIITVTPPQNPRAMSALELAEIASKVHGSVTSADSCEEALELSCLLAGKEGVIICFGSLSYLGVMTRLYERKVTTVW